MDNKLFTGFLIILFLVGFALGLVAGIQTGERRAFENIGLMLEGSTFNVDINETYLMDRTEEITNELIERILESNVLEGDKV